jgi:hypothetical protein
MHHHWYLSIDMDCIFFHVKFGDRLSISVLRNRAALCEKLEFNTDEFSKVPNFKKAATTHLQLVILAQKRQFVYINYQWVSA